VAKLFNVRPIPEAVEVQARQILLRPDEPITAVFFPETGWATMLALLSDG
jgi:CRP-like cAMP-binding protein